MTIWKKNVIRVVSLVLCLAPLGFGQFKSTPQVKHPMLGYYDPATGVFIPVHQEAVDAQDALPATVTPTTGEFVFNFTLTVKSTIPKNAVIGCSAHVSVGETAYAASEMATGIAKLVSGTTYSCSATIPYSWLLSTPTSDSVSITYGTALQYGYQATATNGTATAVEPLSARDSQHSAASIKVPANGATTTEAIAITM